MSIDIPEPNVSLNYCIEQNQNIERLAGNNKYDYQGCKAMT